MSHDLSVLGAMLRLARRRKLAELPDLLVRTGGTAETIRGALGRLAAHGLVERTPGGARLTMGGLAAAVGLAAARGHLRGLAASSRRRAA